MTNNYEMIMIADPGLTDKEAENFFSGFKDFINENGGEVRFESGWGRRRLGYQVQKKNYGIYHLVYFEGNGYIVEELKRQFNYDEKMLKCFIITVKDLEESFNQFEALKENPLKNVNLVSEALGV